MRLLLLLSLAAVAMAQSSHITRITPNGSTVGKIEWYELFTNGQHNVALKAPNSLASSYSLTLPTAAPASNGLCLVGTTAGVLSFSACSGGSFPVADSTDIISGSSDATKLLRFEVDGFTTATTRTLTPQNASYILAGLNLAQTFTAAQTVNAGINSGLIVTDGTTNGIVFASSAATNSLVVGTTTNHSVIVFSNNTEALRVSPGGALLTRSHITTVSPSAADIGDATNYFQTGYFENIDAAPGGVAAAYTKVRKLEIADILGGTAFWDQRANATSVTSAWTLRDNGGSRAVQAVRQEASSPANYIRVFGELRPAKRAIADGDAVDDTPYPEAGNATDRWAKFWGAAADISGTVVAGSLSAGTVTATTAFSAGLDNVTPIGSSSVRISKAWMYDLDAAGTVKLGTSSTIGHVWMATDTAGNGTWSAVPGGVATSRLISTSSPLSGGGDLSADRTLSCPTCYLTTGGTINGGTNAGVTVTDGTVTGILFASSVATNSVVAGTTSAHPFILFGHNGERARLTATGMTVTGTLAVSGITTLSADLLFGSDNAYAIGAAATAPSIVYGRIISTRKAEITDNAGGTAFWDQRVNANGSASDWTLRDNAGSRAILYGRFGQNVMSVFGTLLPAKRNTGAGDSTTDSTFGELGATGSRWAKVWGDDGDFLNGVVAFGSTGFIVDRSSRTASTSQVNFRVASNDANTGNWKLLARPASPATQSEFAITSDGTTVFSMVEGGAASFALGASFGGDILATRISATANGYRIGGTTVIDNSRNLTNIVNLDASGTVKLGTSSIVGYVWTATDTSGNGGWAAAAAGVASTRAINTTSPLGGGGDLSADRTLTCTTCFTTVGGTISGPLAVNNGTNGGVSITDGTSVGIMFASSALTNSIVFGTTSAHPLAVFSGNSFHTAFWPSGNSCVGCTNDTYKWEVNGTFRAAGATTLSSTLDVSGVTTLSSNLAVTGTVKLGTSSTAFQVWTASDSSGNGGWADIGPCATCVTTAANNVSIAGTKTFTGVLTGTGGASISGGNTTVEGIRFAVDATYTIGTSASIAANIFTDDLSVYGAASWISGSSLVFASGSTLTMFGNMSANSLTLTPTELGYLDGVTSNIQTQLNLKGSGTVTSISTSGPISGGTITGSGTISCPNCFTTAGGTVGGSITPGADVTYNLGSASFSWNNAYLDFIYLGAGTLAPNGNFGATTTLTCGTGLAVKNITVSGGIVTAVSCGTP